MFVENGYDATELGQCPYAPGSNDWREWQHDFMAAQTNDEGRLTVGRIQARTRRAAVKEQVLASRTEAIEWHDSVMAEIEEPKPQRVLHGLSHFTGTRWVDDDLYTTIIRRDNALNTINDFKFFYEEFKGLTSVSGSGYTCGGQGAITGTFTVTDPGLWSVLTGDPWDSSARWCWGDPAPSPRQYRRTRGQTIEDRRLCQALSGKPVTVRPSSQNHAWKRK